MSLSEPDRNWDTSQIVKDYPYWIDDKGKILSVGWINTHFNPKLVYKVLFNRKINNVILAVSWNDLNIMAIAFAKRLHLTNKRIFFWAEANYTAEWTKEHNSKLKWWLKRIVFGSVDGAFIIPGRMSLITLEKWQLNVPNIIYLPNTIDDSNLQYNYSIRNNSDIPLFIIPIRIIERVKGGLNFFKSIGAGNIKKAKFVIAGDGEDWELYEHYIKDNGFSENIILEGFCGTQKMSELYSRANALILPSFSDPSPLSLVEALFFHLPIFCSNHCGNHFEAVEEMKNGMTFSPLEPKEIKFKFEQFMSLRFQWNIMGEKSYSIYQDKFLSEKVITNFVESYRLLEKK